MTSALIENPTDLERLASVHRFFIYGINEVADRLQMLICGRFPYRFMGFLYNQKNTQRHDFSQFSVRYWRDALAFLGEGDFVFMAWREEIVERELLAKGVRVGLAANLVHIYGTYEIPTLQHFCKHYVKSVNHAIDVGANTGLTSAVIAAYVKNLTVFEPNPDMIPVIKTSCEGFQHIHLENKAVFNQSGKVLLYPAGLHNTTLVPSDKTTQPYSVDAVTLDAYCEQANLRPEFIKIDVEGVDAEVILGAQNIITEYRPLLFFEYPKIHQQVYATNQENLIQALDFLNEYYDFLAYPTLDGFVNCHKHKDSPLPYLITPEALGMPLDEFEDQFGGLPTNIGALPKPVNKS